MKPFPQSERRGAALLPVQLHSQSCRVLPEQLQRTCEAVGNLCNADPFGAVVVPAGYRYVILDIPLLFETKRLTKFMKHTVLVYCDPQTQLARLRKRSGLSQAEAEARIASQLPLDEKRRLATHVIDNSGDRESTRQQVLRLHARLEDSLDFLWARLALGTAVAALGGLLYLLLQHFIS
ncbi:dephospho-CoA kinase domain-containing protein-like [Meleagris gallopavo]|uniref:dephospho-CoA kinase domain-containing protein-like n=1 Tax=Meleagris gallopavo TaxID=9103 RepID=UPI00093A9644|nr:dephospho-CoA kinase domain-containing protein-like [Meleagris gallopavo]